MYKVIKRVLDIFFSGFALLVLAPVILILTFIVVLSSPGGAFFLQTRLGLDGKEFRMIKFRTMVVGAEHTGTGVYSGKNDPRVTKVGKFLRGSSLDELPQLINVFLGHMSFVGPRPPLTYHPWPLSEYTEEQRHMFDVRPGITGWAQVNGRKNVEWHRRIELNVWYTRNLSLWLDLKILAMTVFKVFRNADNVNEEETLKK